MHFWLNSFARLDYSQLHPLPDSFGQLVAMGNLLILNNEEEHDPRENSLSSALWNIIWRITRVNKHWVYPTQMWIVSNQRGPNRGFLGLALNIASLDFLSYPHITLAYDIYMAVDAAEYADSLQRTLSMITDPHDPNKPFELLLGSRGDGMNWRVYHDCDLGRKILVPLLLEIYGPSLSRETICNDLHITFTVDPRSLQ